MITAEEFLKSKDDYGNLSIYSDEMAIIMIKFAKLHVESALKKVSEKGKIKYSHTETFNGGYGMPSQNSNKYKIDQDSILTAYSLNNIK